MKFLTAIFLLALTLPAWAQTDLNKKVPKYNPAAETVFKGRIEDMVDRRCPVSGGIGSHIELRLDDGNAIEVHLATTDFSKMMQLDLRKGDRVEVTGFKTEFEGIPTIFAREVKRGVDVFVFRDKDGKPAW